MPLLNTFPPACYKGYRVGNAHYCLTLCHGDILRSKCEVIFSCAVISKPGWGEQNQQNFTKRNNTKWQPALSSLSAWQGYLSWYWAVLVLCFLKECWITSTHVTQAPAPGSLSCVATWLQCLQRLCNPQLYYCFLRMHPAWKTAKEGKLYLTLLPN